MSTILSLMFGFNTVFAKNNKPPGFESFTKQLSITWMYVYTVVFLLLIFGCFYLLNKKKLELSIKTERIILMFILLPAFFIKIYLSTRIIGFPPDVKWFMQWSTQAAKDLPNFYNGIIDCDYPPLYIYVLALIGKIAKIFSLHYESGAYLLLVKFPSILAETITAFVLYKASKGNLKKEIGLLIAFAYMFNPAIFLNSALWGQVDSFFVLFIIIAVLFIQKQQLKLATVFFVLAVLIKPHGIIFLPILFFELLKRKKIMNFVQAFVVGMITLIIVILPFSMGKSPLWIVELYIKTAGGYKFASMNAFNLFGLLGANFTEDSTMLGALSYKTWGFIFILAVTLFVGFLVIKSKQVGVCAMASLVIISGVFVLSSRMHERYMFAAIALSILSYVYLRDRRLLIIFAGLTITIFMNTFTVLNMMMVLNKNLVEPNDPVLRIISAANVALLVYMIIVAWDIVIRAKVLTNRQTDPSAS